MFDSEVLVDPGDSTPAGEAPRKRSARVRRAALLVTVGMAVAATGTGLVLVKQAVSRRQVREAVVGGLYLRLDYARWLVDQMDHGRVYPMPRSMMPDMPEHGVERLSAELILYNRSERRLGFSTGELALQEGVGAMQGPVVTYPDRVSLEPGQVFNTVVYFDHDGREDENEGEEEEPEEDLNLIWRRGGKNIAFLIPHPPSHDHDDEDGDLETVEDWPALVTQLPGGDAVAGERLYLEKYGCVACHGHPGLAGSASVGPHLGDIAAASATRVDGKGGRQYIYESILYPNDFIVAECPGGKPCASPSAMPDYRLSLSIENMADLLAYLSGRREP